MLQLNIITKKQVVEEMIYLAYTSISLFITKGWPKSGQELKQGRNLEAGADAETLVRCSLLACFLIETKTISPGMAPPTMHWALPQ